MESKHLNMEMVSIDTMNRQINLRMPDKLFNSAKKYAKKHGYSTVQEFIKEIVREKLYGPELTNEEIKLIERLYKACNEKNLWDSEEEMFDILNKKINEIPN